MKKISRGRMMAAAFIATAAISLPFATASSASAASGIQYPIFTSSMLECQTLGNQLAQQGKLWGFRCEPVSEWVLLYTYV